MNRFEVKAFLQVCLSLSVSALSWTGCSDNYPRIIEEDAGAPLRFEKVRIEPELRRGPDLGMRLWARIDDRHMTDAFHLRFSLLDSLKRPHTGNMMNPGQLLLPETDPQTGDTLCWEYQPALIPGAVQKFDLPEWGDPPVVEFFLPFHWLKLPAGKHTMYLDLEAVAGDLPEATEMGFSGQWGESRSRDRLGYMRVELEVVLPQIYPVEIVVKYIELDVDAFDPHEMDFYLIKAGESYGYPDLYWSLGIGYENVFNSDYFHNSVDAAWKDGTGNVYVRGPEEVVSLCAIDWDNEKVLNNSHDLIGCWEGQLADLSRDSAAPSVLRFHQVRRMEVYVRWITDN